MSPALIYYMSSFIVIIVSAESFSVSWFHHV